MTPPPDAAGHAPAPEHQGVPELARITTRYCPLQDRIGLAGALPDGRPVLLWLTQRLLLRMLPTLTTWLEGLDATHRQPRAAGPTSAGQALYADALQGFAQEAAQAHLTPQTPVQLDTQAPAWLVQTVDVSAAPQALRLVFGDAQGAVAAMEMQAQPLRQWLSIVHKAWRQANWPADPWPTWLQQVPAKSAPAVVH